MKRVRAALAMLLAGVICVLPSGAVMAQTAKQAQDGVTAIGGGNSASMTDTIGLLVNVFLFLVGTLAVVMIIYGGFRYVTSAGDSSAVSSAKNTILYAVVGLIVAITAYAIVNFVIGMFDDTTSRDAGTATGNAARDAADAALDAVNDTPTTQDNSLPPATDQPPSRSGDR